MRDKEPWWSVLDGPDRRMPGRPPSSYSRNAISSFCCEGGLLERQIEPLPDVDQRLGEGTDHAVVMARGRSDAQPLGPLGDGRIVDRLDIDAVFGQQKIARSLAFFRISDHERDNVAVTEQNREPRGAQHGLHARCPFLM